MVSFNDICLIDILTYILSDHFIGDEVLVRYKGGTDNSPLWGPGAYSYNGFSGFRI